MSLGHTVYTVADRSIHTDSNHCLWNWYDAINILVSYVDADGRTHQGISCLNADQHPGYNLICFQLLMG